MMYAKLMDNNIDNDNKKNKIVSRLFPQLDGRDTGKLQIDDDSIHYISIREHANQITSIINEYLKKINLEINDIIITDATAGVGGNTISFGMNFEHVIAIELSEYRCNCLKNNLSMYDLENIKIINGDCINILNEIKNNIIFMDPPWGGRDYKNKKNLRLQLSNQPIEKVCNELFDKQRKNLKLIVLKLPTNYDTKNLYNVINSNELYLHNMNKMLIVVIYSPHI